MSNAVWFNLFPNKFHQKGDKKPCLTPYKNELLELDGKKYKVAIWAPKEGKKSYSVMFDLVEEESTNNEKSEPQPEVENGTPPPSTPAQAEVIDNSEDW